MTRWRTALLSLSSETFLDLARIYLGKIRTPFSKQELLDRLEALLRRGDVRERIAGLLDPEDAAMVSAVFLLGDPEPSRLADFLLPLPGSEASAKASVLSRLVNLEERLILYEYHEEGLSPTRVGITPALADLMAEYAFEPALLFPEEGSSLPDAVPSAADPALSRAALVSFFLDPAHAPKADPAGLPRAGAKLLKAFHEAFPAGPEAQSAMEGLRDAGVLRPEAARLVADARAAVHHVATEGAEWLAEDPSAGDAEAARAYLAAALAERASLGTLARLRLLMLGGGLDSGRARRLLAGMETESGQARSSACSLDADYSLHARSGLRPADLALLALCAELVRLDGAASFRLSRSSAARAFRAGLDASSLAARLESLTGRPLPQNVAYSLEAWDREHRSLTLVSGIVICCDERASRFMEASPALRDRIVRTLAPGVFLSDFSNRAEAEESLARAGLATPPALVDASLPGQMHPFSSPAPEGRTAQPPAAQKAIPSLPDFSARRKAPAVAAEAIRAEREASLEASRPPRDLREALEERIRLKLLVSDSGLEPDSMRYEKWEAGGLDYLGKMRLVERAARERSWLLEILYRPPGADPETLLVRPLALRKQNGSLRLDCLRAESPASSAPSGPPLSLSVERISKVRRVRTSIFSP